MGQPGVPAAVAVPFTPDVSFDSAAMAASIAASINGSALTSVEATVRGGDVFVGGAASIVGVTVNAISGIEDLAGNGLRPNQPDGETRFQIIVGRGLDFGDAPDPPYATLEKSNGASHEVLPGYCLGLNVDSDLDGQPTAGATGDGADDDGVSFDTALVGAFNATITVTASGVTLAQPAALDAWIDFDQDGLWESSEQIFASEPLIDGDTVLTFKLPGTAKQGTTYARFRMSSTGGLAPTGPAADGEVEDYAVTITANPWRNAAFPEDVSVPTDGIVSPVDALQIINRLNPANWGPGPLPPTRPANEPYLDVNGDGLLSVIDAFMVINYLNIQAASGSGEGQSLKSSVVAAPVAAAVAEGEAASGVVAVLETLAATSVSDASVQVSSTATVGRQSERSVVLVGLTPLAEPLLAATGESQSGKASSSEDGAAATNASGYWVSPPFELPQSSGLAESSSLSLSSAADDLDELLAGIAEDVGRLRNAENPHDAVLTEILSW